MQVVHSSGCGIGLGTVLTCMLLRHTLLMQMNTTMLSVRIHSVPATAKQKSELGKLAH